MVLLWDWLGDRGEGDGSIRIKLQEIIILLGGKHLILKPIIVTYCLSLSVVQMLGWWPFLLDVGKNIHP